MIATDQLTLGIESPHMALWPYWKRSLAEAIKDAYYYRNHRGCTGWAYAIDGYSFARNLFRDGQMTVAELRRYYRFFRRLQRMEREFWAKEARRAG